MKRCVLRRVVVRILDQAGQQGHTPPVCVLEPGHDSEVDYSCLLAASDACHGRGCKVPEMPGTRLRLVRRPATASTIGMPPASSWLMSHAPENGVEPTLVEFCDMHHPKIKVRKKNKKEREAWQPRCRTGEDPRASQPEARVLRRAVGILPWEACPARLPHRLPAPQRSLGTDVDGRPPRRRCAV